MNRAERLARLLRVLAAIIAEPGLNPLELAEKAGVSERTLRRDLSQLRELGYEVAYTSGYEVQEKLNLEGRGKKTTRPRGDDALLQAVAHAVEAARDKVMADEVKLLTKLGIPKAMAYQMIASRFHQKVGNQEEAETDPFEGNATTSWEEIG